MEACYFPEESAKRGPPSRRPESREETPKEAYAASLLHRTIMLQGQICSMGKADHDLPLPSGRHVLRRVCLLRRSLFHGSRWARSSQESWCPRSTRSAVLATLPLNVLDGSLYAAVQQEIAITHFLGVSSLNSGRGQPRPFFIDPFAEQISASGTAATGGDAIERIAVGMRITTAIHRTGRIIR